mmetsp:Transcript_43388/g.90623  ORF Transcript_43388/g.90623 Transcript_43388/m.90623 type:complete len:217 (+) Transcript_43388:397-1047(+)
MGGVNRWGQDDAIFAFAARQTTQTVATTNTSLAAAASMTANVVASTAVATPTALCAICTALNPMTALQRVCTFLTCRATGIQGGLQVFKLRLNLRHFGLHLEDLLGHLFSLLHARSFLFSIERRELEDVTSRSSCWAGRLRPAEGDDDNEKGKAEEADSNSLRAAHASLRRLLKVRCIVPLHLSHFSPFLSGKHRTQLCKTRGHPPKTTSMILTSA